MNSPSEKLDSGGTVEAWHTWHRKYTTHRRARAIARYQLPDDAEMPVPGHAGAVHSDIRTTAAGYKGAGVCKGQQSEASGSRYRPASLRWLHDRNGESSEAVNLPCLVTLAPERPRSNRVSTSSFGPDITASMFARFSSFFLTKNYNKTQI